LNARTLPVIPDHETRRMSAVRRYDILDTPPDGSFDRITALAARRFNVPIAVVSIVDTDRIWFKSAHGLPVAQIERAPGLCASAILANEPYILADASRDPRSLANPLVAGEFGLRFYVGVPLTTADGYNLGTLCVIDKAPRTVDQEQINDLHDLAAVVMDQLELRLSARRAIAHAGLMAREIDHRVMNSLQFISAVLTMQSRAVAGTDAAGPLRVAANRVTAVAQVHRNFHAAPSAAGPAGEVSCIEFLRRLCVELAGILGRDIAVQGDEDVVPTENIQPIGLIVNELVTNAAKHGEGNITVDYRCSGGQQHLTVWDQGAGPPPGFDPQTSNGLGMKVLLSLVRQLNGALLMAPSPGGQCFSVVF
jgi:two-component sensor histidine kinase